jgi:TonB family protein
MLNPVNTVQTKTASLILRVILILSACLAAYGQANTPTKTISGGVLNGKALSLPKPAYPSDLHGVTGEVKVKILIDENGKVESATVFSGVENASLRQAALDAARQATFTPTLLEGKPAKVSGVIEYRFLPEKRGYQTEAKYVALSMLLRLARASVSDLDKFNSFFGAKDIFKMAADVPDLPAQAAEISRLESLDKMPVEKRIEVIDSVSSSMRSKLSGSDKWQFEVGENFVDAIAPLVQHLVYTQPPDFRKLDESAIKASLKKLKDLTLSPPPRFPNEVLEKLKNFAAAGDKENLLTRENLRDLIARMMALLETISPEDESPGH